MEEVKREEIREIDINLIDKPEILLHPETDLKTLEELASSIREQGLINPIVIRPKGSRYQLVAGYRRYLACKKFGITTIMARIIYMNDAQALLTSATENIQRKDLDPIAEGKLYLRLIEELGIGTKEVGEKVGKSESYVRARLALLDQPKEIQELARGGKLKLGIVPYLSKVKDLEERIMVAGDIAKRGYTIESAKYVINAFLEIRKKMKERKPQEALKKAREEPLGTCEWCKEKRKVRWFRRIVVCDGCYRRLIFLWEKESQEVT